MRIAIAGGTGTVGRQVVARVVAAGHEPVVLARAAGVDLRSGEGVGEALDGVEAVIDVLNVPTTRRRPATEFFVRTSERLLGAGAAAGVRHHVLLSIVGIDDVPMGYYRAKLAQERLVAASAVPTTILRSAQFHDFAGQLLDRQRGPVRGVPAMPVRPVATREVAARLLELAAGAPLGRAEDLVGPRTEALVDLARRTVRAREQRCRVLGLPLPGPAGRAVRAGALCGGPEAERGDVGFDDWLEATHP